MRCFLFTTSWPCLPSCERRLKANSGAGQSILQSPPAWLHSTVEQLRPQLSLLGSESALRQVWGYTAWVSTWGNGWEPVEAWGNPLLQGFYDGKGDPQNPTLLQEEEMPMFSHSWTPSYHQLSSTRIATEGCVTPLAGTFLWERQAPH